MQPGWEGFTQDRTLTMAISSITTYRNDLGQALQPVLSEVANSARISSDRMVQLVEGLIDNVGRAEEGEQPWRTELRRTTIDRTLEDILLNIVSLK